MQMVLFQVGGYLGEENGVVSELLRADARTNAALREVLGAGGGIRLCMRRYVAAPCRSRMLPTPVRNARRLLGFVVVMIHYLTLLRSLR